MTFSLKRIIIKASKILACSITLKAFVNFGLYSSPVIMKIFSVFTYRQR